jgi:uncharacterized iron-regulated membrane protein
MVAYLVRPVVLLAAVCRFLTGTLAVFEEPITHWMTPGASCA